MADLALRFFKDMLVLSSPAQELLRRAGIASAREQALALLLEPETVEEAYRIEAAAGPQCLVAPTAYLTPARLVEVGMEGNGPQLAANALEVLAPFKPQHTLVELAPCGLPLDASSKASLVENRDQYARAAMLFSDASIDAFLLNGFTTCDDLKCALMGLRKVSDAPILASVDVRPNGELASGRSTLAETAAVMAEYGASVAGFSTAGNPDVASYLTQLVRNQLEAQGAGLCVMATLKVAEREAMPQASTPANPYPVPDAMAEAALLLRNAGAQFLRASGAATPAYTGVLAATIAGLDVIC